MLTTPPEYLPALAYFADARDQARKTIDDEAMCLGWKWKQVCVHLPARMCACVCMYVCVCVFMVHG